jgi:hypothetical protein
MFDEARRLFERGENVVEALGAAGNDERRIAIEIAYSLQSGSYTKFAETEVARATRREGHNLVAPFMKDLGIASVLDCGAGEGTRWFDFTSPIEHLYCLDVSMNRMTYCNKNIYYIPGITNYTCIKGNMTSLPFAPRAVDAVFSCHAIEPNTDHDTADIIRQMFTIARKMVVILEPNYRDASPEMRARMERHGYARNIWDEAERQAGFELVAEGKFINTANPLNRTSYMILKRTAVGESGPYVPASPLDGTQLSRRPQILLDENNCFCFPVVGDILCLDPEDAIFVGCDPTAT